MAKSQPQPLFMKLSGASGLHVQSPESSPFADTIHLTVFGSESRARTERYVEMEFEIDRAQIINLAYNLWQYIDAEQGKVDQMRKRMRREA